MVNIKELSLDLDKRITDKDGILEGEITINHIGEDDKGNPKMKKVVVDFFFKPITKKDYLEAISNRKASLNVGKAINLLTKSLWDPDTERCFTQDEIDDMLSVNSQELIISYIFNACGMTTDETIKKS